MTSSGDFNAGKADAENQLGSALKAAGRFGEAIAAFNRALSLNPSAPGIYANLGAALHASGQPMEAVIAFQNAIALKPDFYQAHYNLGNVFKELARHDEAIAAYRMAVQLTPEFAPAWINLASTLAADDRLDDSICAYRRAVALNPHHSGLIVQLGDLLKNAGKIDEAILTYKQAITLDSQFAGAYNNLAIAFHEKGNLDDAIATYRRAVAIDPAFAEAHANLGVAMRDSGQIDEAISHYRQAILLQPNSAQLHSSLLFIMQFHPGYDAGTIASEHRLWNKSHAERLKPKTFDFPNDREPDRRLRIGYVSGDLCDHPVGRFMLSLIECRDRAAFEIYAYSNGKRIDVVTERIIQGVNHWRTITRLEDDEVVRRIRDDRIDILVDLSLHTADNRLLVFAQKPAPVQVTYLAYPGTSGLDTMDYRLSDPWLDPPGADELVYSEKTVRLPRTYWCYAPPADVQVNSLPAMKNGFITFGSLNSFSKVNELLLGIWGKLLAAVPTARLLIHSLEGSHRQRALHVLQYAGIAPARVNFAGRMSLNDYYNSYHGIDICLDTTPYCGGTTTCDALWMGVPVVSLVGPTLVGRGGLSILSNIGLAGLAVRTENEYVEVASSLAADLPGLSQIRSRLRQQMRSSPLMDAPRFAGDVERAFRDMWRRRCEASSA